MLLTRGSRCSLTLKHFPKRNCDNSRYDTERRPIQLYIFFSFKQQITRNLTDDFYEKIESGELQSKSQKC